MGWRNENTLNYDRTFGKHTLGGLVAVTLNKDENRYLNATGKGFDMEMESLQYMNFAGSKDASDSYGIDSNIAFVARVSYSFDDRYFLTASWRRDYADRQDPNSEFTVGDYEDYTSPAKNWSDKYMTFPYPSEQINKSAGKLQNPPTWK